MGKNAATDALIAQMVKEKVKGRTPEQESVIRYFYNCKKGCFGKLMSDSDYDKMVADYLSKNNNFKDKAISKIGLDESEISLIAPVCIKGYRFNEKKALTARGKDGYWRSSLFQVSWLFFSETQVYLYQYTFNFAESSQKETTEEYFYRDIVNFASSTESEEKEYYILGGCMKNKPIKKLENVDYVTLKVVVPGDNLYCSASVTDDSFETSIKGMKSLLREKKNG